MAKEIVCTTLLILEEQERGDTRTLIRIVTWNDGKPMLEKRSQFMNTEGDWQTGKAKGFNQDDMELLFANQNKISKIMKGGKGEEKTKGKKGKKGK